MKSITKIVLCGLAAAVIAVAAVVSWQNHRDHQLVLAAEQADTETVNMLQTKFPVGTTLEDVLAGLRAAKSNVHEYNDQILLEQGSEPSFVFGCGPFTRFVIFRFSPGDGGVSRLTGITHEARGMDCM